VTARPTGAKLVSANGGEWPMNARRLALYLLPLAAFVVLAAFLLRGLWLNPREVPSPLIGKPAPLFTLPGVHDQTPFSSKDLLGQVWIMNVWASWCAPCRIEHPLFNDLAARKLVPIVGLNYKDAPEAARRWLAELGDPYLVSVIDNDGRTGIDFGVYGVPETFVIDRHGVIRHKHIGLVTAEAMRDRIIPIVRELQQKS
jgi:cytochrome c biogenesis protein CcmG/thiol:disulfide interchange protein DsbE